MDKETTDNFKRVFEIFGALAKKALTCNHSELDRTSKANYRCIDCGKYFKVSKDEVKV